MRNAYRLLSVLCLAPALLTACATPFGKGELSEPQDAPAPAVGALETDDDRGSGDEPTSKDDAPPSATERCDAVVDEPAGAFTFDDWLGVGVDPVDVFAEERVYEITPPGEPTEHVRTLVIAFGETTQECARREHGAAARHKSEVRLLVSRTSTSEVPGPLEEGTYVRDLWIEEEAGERCVPAGVARDGSSDPTVTARRAKGRITITRRTDESIEGTFVVPDSDGEVVLQGSFVAPICTTPEVESPVCCDLRSEDSVH